MKKTLYIFLSLIFFLSVSSCTDDFPLGDYEIGEGEAVLSATVNFHPEPRLTLVKVVVQPPATL